MSCPKGIHSHTLKRCRVEGCGNWAVLEERHCRDCGDEIAAVSDWRQRREVKAEAARARKAARKAAKTKE